MKKTDRSRLGLGIILVLLGGWFIAQNNFPPLQEWVQEYYEWPVGIVAVGAGLLLLGMIIGEPGMSIPAAIVAGVGGILHYQNTTGEWATWSYMWTLIPGFVGVGTVVAGLLGENTRSNIRHGLNLMVVSAVLFLVFSAFFGGWTLFGSLGPAVVLILLGLYVIGTGLISTTRKSKDGYKQE
ncbi:MAG: hypothetical protein JXA13_06660 [Anaerolineales bacterium]|nr:hypothetical protein [Anaerolineales bacterium]